MATWPGQQVYLCGHGCHRTSQVDSPHNQVHCPATQTNLPETSIHYLSLPLSSTTRLFLAYSQSQLPRFCHWLLPLFFFFFKTKPPMTSNKKICWSIRHNLCKSPKKLAWPVQSRRPPDELKVSMFYVCSSSFRARAKGKSMSASATPGADRFSILGCLFAQLAATTHYYLNQAPQESTVQKCTARN